MHDQDPRQVPPPDSQTPRRPLPPDAECAKPKQSPVPLRAPCGESFAPWIPDSKLPTLPKNSVNSLIRKILLATPEFPRFYADFILALAPNSNEARILRPHYQKILAKVNGRRSPVAKDCVGTDAVVRPGREATVPPPAATTTVNVPSAPAAVPPHDFKKILQTPSTPTKAAPAFAIFEGWEPRSQSHSTQAASHGEPSSEGAQDCSPRRKAWVTSRKEAQAPKGRKKFCGPTHPGRRTAEAAVPTWSIFSAWAVVLSADEAASLTLGRDGRIPPSLHNLENAP